MTQIYIKIYIATNEREKNIFFPTNPIRMSTFKEKISALFTTHKELFTRHGIKLNADDAQKMKFEAEATDESGNMVYTPAAAFEVGAEVFVMDADGNPQPASDGEYILDGVTKIIVAEGVITEVEAVESAASEDMADVISQLADRLTAIESKLSETETKLSTAETELASVTKRAKEAEAKVAKLSKVPVAGVKEQKFKAEKKSVELPKNASTVEKIAARLAANN
jgi:hypothetical protein